MTAALGEERRPFCWWVVVVIDHFSRAAVGHAVFKKQPSAADVVAVLEAAVCRARRAPKYIITDQGSQFAQAYRTWCAAHGTHPRFGAIGKSGSIASTERFIRSLKDEALRRILVPLRQDQMEAELDAFVGWYNGFRPHDALGGATPNEVHRKICPACRRPRIAPRGRYPTRPGERLRGKKGAVVGLVVAHHEGNPHLPVIRLRVAA